MARTTYPNEFIEAVKEAYPNNKSLLSLLELGIYDSTLHRQAAFRGDPLQILAMLDAEDYDGLRKMVEPAAKAAGLLQLLKKLDAAQKDAEEKP